MTPWVSCGQPASCNITCTWPVRMLQCMRHVMGDQLCRNRNAEWTPSTMSLRSEAMGTLLTASEDYFVHCASVASCCAALCSTGVCNIII